MKKKDYETIIDHAMKILPHEACGLLAGTVKEGIKYIEKVYLLKNPDESSEHFSIDPTDQLEAIKDSRANDFILLGNFHSHPQSPSRPSDEDKLFARDPKIDYMILSLMNPDIPVLKAFKINKDKDVSEEPIEII